MLSTDVFGVTDVSMARQDSQVLSAQYVEAETVSQHGAVILASLVRLVPAPANRKGLM